MLSLVILAVVLSSVGVNCQNRTWTLGGDFLSPSGSFSGYFTYDASTSTIKNISVTTTNPANSAFFHALTYTQGNATQNAGDTIIVLFNNPETRSLTIRTTTALTLDGGNVTLDNASGSTYETSTLTSARRTIISGFAYATPSLTTQPLTTQKLTTQPLTTQPLTTQPLTTKPLTTQPLTTQPLTTQPLTTQEMTTQELTTQEMTTQPLTTQEMTTQPLTTQELTTQELTTQELTTQELTTQPLTTQPLTTQPLTTHSLTTSPVLFKPISIYGVVYYADSSCLSSGLTYAIFNTSETPCRGIVDSCVASSQPGLGPYVKNYCQNGTTYNVTTLLSGFTNKTGVNQLVVLETFNQSRCNNANLVSVTVVVPGICFDNSRNDGSDIYGCTNSTVATRRTYTSVNCIGNNGLDSLSSCDTSSALATSAFCYAIGGTSGSVSTTESSNISAASLAIPSVITLVAALAAMLF